MELNLSAYGSSCKDNLGYRWLWHAPELSGHILNQFYRQLDVRRLNYADELKKLRNLEHCDGGIIAASENICIAYRFLYGGRECNREKFYLIAAFFCRDNLKEFDFVALLQSQPFTTVMDGLPPNVTFPKSSTTHPVVPNTGKLPINFSRPQAITQGLAVCASIIAPDRFHLTVNGKISSPTIVISNLSEHIKSAPSVPIQKPLPRIATSADISRHMISPTVQPQHSTKRTSYKATIFTIGLLVLAYVFFHQKRNSITAPSEPIVVTVRTNDTLMPPTKQKVLTNSLIQNKLVTDPNPNRTITRP